MLQIRDQKLSNSGFHNSSKFLGKGDSVSQTRISDIEGSLDPREAPQGPRSALIGCAFEIPTNPDVRRSRDLLYKTNNSKN